MKSSPATESISAGAWPALPLEGWAETYATVHLWSQVVGKVALALAPPINHSWGIALHLTPRGLTTLPLPHGVRTFTMAFDFVDHALVVAVSDGATWRLALEPRPVADFYAQVMAGLRELGLPVKIWPVAVELPSPIRLDQDVDHRSYDRDAVGRFWMALQSITRVLNGCRCDFAGKSSPVHFFWGAFDLAVTRFSGRLAPPREGPAFMREAYSHEVISHGFWPGMGVLHGGGPVQEPAFYAYAVPEPAGLKTARVRPEGAYYSADLGEFILPYEAVRTSASPEAMLTEFVRSTYEAASTLAGWDRGVLDHQPPR
jgi:hypothetical protein